jgi:selenide, water dikinase
MATREGSRRLTAHSHGAGCACKISAAELAPFIEALPSAGDPNLLVGAATRDDAAVYRLTDDLALVQTADFFTPIVDDPFDFGRIAAANALSDIYAMGAKPVLAINLVAFSIPELGGEVLAEILRGGATVAGAAGIPVGGGHSIDDPEPKYGMAVSGVVHPQHVVTNAGARPGDELHLSKPLGGGLVTTGAKRGLAAADMIEAAIEVMCELNAEASDAALAGGVTAMTDVTGFGLLGHLHELCEASGVAAELEAEAVPSIPGALELAEEPACIAGGSRRNAEHADTFTVWREVEGPPRVLLTDAMTSGGLLAATPPGARMEGFVRIGRVAEGPPGRIEVR